MLEHAPMAKPGLRSAKKRRQRGFTIMEFTLVTLLFLVVLSAIGGGYLALTSSSRQTSTIQAVNALASNVRKVFAADGGLPVPAPADLSVPVTNAGGMPTFFTPTVGAGGAVTGVTSPWGAVAVVSASATSFTVQLNGLPSDACIALARANLGQQSVTIGAVGGAALVGPVTLAAAQGGCNAGGATNQILWTFAF